MQRIRVEIALNYFIEIILRALCDFVVKNFCKAKEETVDHQEHKEHEGKMLHIFTIKLGVFQTKNARLYPFGNIIVLPRKNTS